MYTISASTLAAYASLGEPQGVYTGTEVDKAVADRTKTSNCESPREEDNEQPTCKGQRHDGMVMNSVFSIDSSLSRFGRTEDPPTQRSCCIGKHVSIIRGPWKSYRGRVISTSRDDAFLVELEIVGRFCVVRRADLALVW